MARKSSNNVRQLREEQLLSKAELARRAGLSPLTIDRVERGEECRVDTKRKIILALGLSIGDRARVFGGDAPKRRTSARRSAASVAKAESLPPRGAVLRSSRITRK